MDAINTAFTQPQIICHFPPRVIAKISIVCKAFHDAISGREFDGYWRNWLGKTVPLDSMKEVKLIYPTLSSKFSPWNKQLLAGLVACIDMEKELYQLIREEKLEHREQYNDFIIAQKKSLNIAYHVAIHFFRLDMAKLEDIECWVGNFPYIARILAYPEIAFEVLKKEGSLDYAKNFLHKEACCSPHRTYLAKKLFSLFLERGYLLEILELLEAWYLQKGVLLKENMLDTAEIICKTVCDFMLKLRKASSENREVQERINQFIAKFDQLFPEHQGELTKYLG